jgi:cell division protease FtsH
MANENVAENVGVGFEHYRPKDHGDDDIQTGGEAVVEEADASTGEHPVFLKITGSAVRSAIVREALDAAIGDENRIRLLQDTRPLAVVIQVPSRQWISPVKRLLEEHKRGWYIVARTGESKTEHSPSFGNKEVADALAEGRTVVGVATHPDMYLPATLLTAVDIRATVRAPDAAILGRVLRLFYQEEGGEAVMGDNAVAGLDIDDVVAAVREGSTAKDAVDRMGRASEHRLAGDITAGIPRLETAIEFGAAREFGLAIVRDIILYKSGVLPWSDCMKGGLLYGYHGTGKSLLAASIASAAGIPLLRISPGGLFDKNSHLGTVVGELRDLMGKASAMARAGANGVAGNGAVLVVLEEVEGLCPRRDQLGHHGRDWWMPIIDFTLLACDAGMTESGGDGVSGVGRAAGVFILATTNHPQMIEPAMLRANRLERAIEVKAPNVAGLANIIRFHLGSDLPGADLRPIAQSIAGSTAAECMAHVREARRAARAEGRAMRIEDLAEATRGKDDLSETLAWRISVHESAHAVATVATGIGTLEYVSIRGRGMSGGQTVSLPDEEDLPTLDLIERDAVVALAAGAAEESIVGSLSMGWAGGGHAFSDLGRVSRQIAMLHASSGLMGRLLMRADNDEAALAAVRADPVLCVAVERHMQDLHDRARELVGRHRDRIVAVAKALFKRRHLDAAEVVSILAAVPQNDERVVRDTALEIVSTESGQTDGDDVDPLRPFK